MKTEIQYPAKQVRVVNAALELMETCGYMSDKGEALSVSSETLARKTIKMFQVASKNNVDLPGEIVKQLCLLSEGGYQEDNEKTIGNWFKQAVPNPTEKNFQVQLGCHLEEVAEMLAVLVPKEGTDPELSSTFDYAAIGIGRVANLLKSGKLTVEVTDEVEFLDSIGDQNVTGKGLAHMRGADFGGAINEINGSNWSKFVNGKPIFDENGKIKKGPNYYSPSLAQYVKNK